MKIFIEATSIFKYRSGVGQYSKRLSETLVQQNPQNEFTFFSFNLWPRALPPREIKGPNVNYRFIRLFPGKIYNQLLRMNINLPIDLLLRRQADIIFYPNFRVWPMFSRKTKTMVVIHDLSFIYYPQYSSPRNLRDNLKFVPRAITKANRVIAVSNSSKGQIVDHYGTDPAKITVVYNAVDHSEYYPRSAKEVSAIRNKYKLPAKYILFTGTIEPRKNVVGILNAYAALDERVKKDYGLVLAGGKGWNDESIRQAIDRLQSAGEKIICTGYVPDKNLPMLFSGASLFVWPSFYEGFGVPPLEAMACGVPVITSDNSSLPEVVGDAAIKVKAENTAAISKAMASVLTNAKLAAELRQKGLVQAKLFSWEKSAEILMDVFNELDV